MRKFFLILFLQTILVLGIFPSNFSKAFADSACTSVSANPSPPLPKDQKALDLTIETPGLLDYDPKKDNSYLVTLNGSPIRDQWNFLTGTGSIRTYQVNGKKMIISNLAESGETIATPNTMDAWKPKMYTISIYDKRGISQANKLCSADLDLAVAGPSADGGTSGSCSINFTNPTWKPDDDIKIVVNGLAGNPADQHRVIIRRNNAQGTPVSDVCQRKADLENEVSIGKHEVGKYYLEISDSCAAFLGWDEKFACAKGPFTITSDGVGGGPGEPIEPTQTPAPLPPPCSGWVDANGNPAPSPDPRNTDYKLSLKCAKINTAIGEFNTEPQKFIERILGLILGLSGGIALLLIIMSGYKIMASQGNPEKLQGAREGLTSTIVGLIFIIFSFIILQLIGADILKIPGFKP